VTAVCVFNLASEWNQDAIKRSVNSISLCGDGKSCSNAGMAHFRKISVEIKRIGRASCGANQKDIFEVLGSKLC